MADTPPGAMPANRDDGPIAPVKKLSEAVYRAIVEGSPIAKVLVNRQGLIVLVNAQIENLFGYARGELLGKPIEVLVPRAARGHHPALRDSYFKDPKPRFMGAGRDLSGTRKDGSEFPVEIALNPIRTADGEFVLSAITDITERKRAEEKFRTAVAQEQASQYARSLIEASLDPLVTISAEGKITDVNEGSIKATGVAREKLIGTDFSNYFAEPDLARKGYQEAFARGSVTDYPLTIRHKDGRLTDVLYNASVYKDADGKVLGVFAAARDVTRQREAEAEVAKQRAKEMERLAELERFQRLTVGRELKMIELKKEIEELKKRAGEPR